MDDPFPVLLDITPVGSEVRRRTGLARVALSLARALQRRPDVKVVCTAWGSVFASYDFIKVRRSENLRGARGKMGPVSLWYARVYTEMRIRGEEAGPLLNLAGRVLNRFRRPLSRRELAKYRLVHSTYAKFPPWLSGFSGPRVITVHDLTPFVLDEDLLPPGQRGITNRIFQSIREDDWVACVSGHTRKDLLDRFGGDPDRRRVIPNGVDLQLFRPKSPADCRPILEKYGIEPGRPFLLTISSLAPHKNLRRLVWAWQSLPPEQREGALVIAGGRTASTETLLKELDLPGEAPRGLRVIGFVPDNDYAALASACRGFFFPSLYEGFGLPVLEAMACGAPVWASDCSSIPEVMGGLGNLFDPESSASIGEALIAALASEPDPTAAEERRVWAERFSWEAAADAYITLYRDALAAQRA